MQSYWRASLRAPDGTEMADVFNGEATEAKAWDAAQAYFLSTVLPKMLEVGNDDMSVTSYAHGRFTDALLSAASCDEIVLWCDPWELRLEHYPEEFPPGRRRTPGTRGGNARGQGRDEHGADHWQPPVLTGRRNHTRNGKMSEHSKLVELLSTMNVPSERAKVRDEQDIHWLGRNLAMQNADHPRLDEARELLEGAGARMVV